MVDTPAIHEKVGFLFAMSSATDAWAVSLRFPESSVVCGGMSAASAVRAKQPWSERYEELRAVAEKLSEETLPEDEVGTLLTVFRRDPDSGGLCLSGNQVRTMLQEAAAALYTGMNGYYQLRRALRGNLRVEPTLLPILRDGKPVKEPDGILELPRPIRKPPYERSVIQRPEFLRGPLEVGFVILASRVGVGEVITGEVVQALLEYAGEWLGLGAQRGLHEVIVGQPGKFALERFEAVELERKAFPKLVVKAKRAKDAAET